MCFRFGPPWIGRFCIATTSGGLYRPAPAGVVYIIIYDSPFVNADIYMNFRDATDALCSKLGHEEVAKALGVSVQAVRQARMENEAVAYRKPPEDWRATVISLAEQRVRQYRNLIEELCKDS